MDARELAKMTADLIRQHIGNAVADVYLKVESMASRVDGAETLINEIREKTDSGELNGKDGADGKDGVDGRDGEDGIDGKDAIQIQPVDMDEFKSYARGTYAFFKGGTVYAFRKTDILDEWKGNLELHGWAVALNGLSEVKEEEVDERTTKFIFEYTDGTRKEYERKTDAQIYRGVWKAGEYQKGDTVSKRGSMWHCNKPTSDSPGTKTDAWTLCVKEGRQGRSVNHVS